MGLHAKPVQTRTSNFGLRSEVSELGEAGRAVARRNEESAPRERDSNQIRNLQDNKLQFMLFKRIKKPQLSKFDRESCVHHF